MNISELMSNKSLIEEFHQKCLEQVEIRDMIQKIYNLGFKLYIGKSSLEEELTENTFGGFDIIKNNKAFGTIFELVFRSVLQNTNLKEKEDFLDLRFMNGGYPDFFFPLKKTFVELKSSCNGNNGKPVYTYDQIERIKLLQEAGYNMKTVLLKIEVLNSVTNLKDGNIIQLISSLK